MTRRGSKPQTIFAGAASNSNAEGVTKSRLLTDSTEIRNILLSRNLYTPDNEFPFQNQSDVNKIVNAVNTVIDIIAPFKSFDLKNTVFGRLVGDQTPLSEISLALLGRQFALNSMSHTSQKVLPTIRVSNLFDGNKDTTLFTANKNYSITVREDTNFFQRFLDNTVYFYPNKDYPFSEKSKDEDYIKNTGTGQLNNLYNAINRNLYKRDKATNTVFYDYAKKSDSKILPRGTIFGGDDKNIGTGDDDRKFFDYNNRKFNPYFSLTTRDSSILLANQSMYFSYTVQESGDVFGYNGTSTSSEYAPNINFVNDTFGSSHKSNEKDSWSETAQNTWIDDDVEFKNGNVNENIVWGRDGITPDLLERSTPLRGDFGTTAPGSNLRNYGVKGGLLEYTRNFINSTDGQIGDTTRKAFTKNGKVTGFNGSAMWKSNDSDYASFGEVANTTGIRQHNTFDQYDRFAKAIRFNGNEVYGGNINSVTYKSVIPHVAPYLDDKGDINNKNLMFSIENLAIRVYKDNENNVGIIDDEVGSVIPLTEAGPFNGRVMWFAPYDITINETATAKFESTVMIGRNEPMYNYQNSERSATLNFLLLMDYPEQLKNYRSNTGGQQREIAEFFAFGGNKYFVDKPIKPSDAEKQIKDNEEEIKSFLGPDPSEPLPPNTERRFKIYFPNDSPVESEVNTVINKMYNTLQYEININTPSKIVPDNTHLGLNRNIYYITGLTENGSELVTAVEQYNQPGIVGQEIDLQPQRCNLNEALKDIFGDDNLRPYYDIIIYGSATKFFKGANEAAYNKALGLRRANAAKRLVEERLKALIGTSKANEIIGDGSTTSRIKFDPANRGSIGSEGADAVTADETKIYEQAAKERRFAEITIKRNSETVKASPKKLSKEDQDKIETLRKENDKLREDINRQKARDLNLYNERKLDVSGANDGGILHGFKSVSGNYFYPVFHSQTPQDLHERLTFLHQCTRQGAAKRYDTQFDSNGVLRARNSVFGRQPICIIRVGDLFYTKVIIESVNFDYVDNLWDMNPEGHGLQPMMVKVTLQMKLIGGQSLKGPIDALQNAVSFNYYANSTFGEKNIYNKKAIDEESKQESYINGILTNEQANLKTAHDKFLANSVLNSLNNIGTIKI